MTNPNYLTDHLLNARQRGFGMELVEDDHTLTLKRKDEVLGRWAITPAHPTPMEISEYADRIIEAEEYLFTVIPPSTGLESKAAWMERRGGRR